MFTSSGSVCPMNKPGLDLSNFSPRQKQLLTLAVIVVGILILAVGGVWLTDNSGTSKIIKEEKPVTTRIANPGAQPGMKEVWITKSEGQLKDLETQLKQLKEELRVSKKDRETADKTNNEKRQAEEALKSARQDQSTGRSMPTTPPPGFSGADVRGPQSLGAAHAPGRNPTNGHDLSGAPQNNRPLGVMNVSVSPSEDALVPAKTEKQRTTENYIFSGAITQAILLSGMDAPTGGQAQSNPHPVLLKLTNLSILPSHLRYDMRECFVLASGYGDISSERAFIRAEKISCATNDGRVIDHELKGFVAGPDGKAGIRGRLVTKQGQILMNALIAGIGSGIGSAFQQQNTTQSISPLGVTETVNSQQVVNSGLGEGIHSAMDRLAKYYIDLANKLFPIIEIDAGWNVDLIITEGFYFDENPPATAKPALAQRPKGETLTAVPARFTTGVPKND